MLSVIMLVMLSGVILSILMLNVSMLFYAECYQGRFMLIVIMLSVILDLFCHVSLTLFMLSGVILCILILNVSMLLLC
jgi:hypothetical protein